jgi:uncharacterized BrkB/YihY/UPF0761 family membrane protein
MTGSLRGVARWSSHRYRRLPEPVRRFVAWVRSPEFVTTSSSLAFYAMISLPPMTLLGFWIAGWFVDEAALQDLGNQVDSSAPERLPAADVLRALIDVAAQAGPLAAVAAVWPATTYGAALARAFSDIAPESERRIRGWKGRLLTLVVIAALPVVVFSGLATVYVVPRLLGSGAALQLALGAGALVALVAVISLIYALFELRDTRWHDVVSGAATATALVALSTTGYLLYLEFADFTQRYGATALATAVLLGLWLLLGNAALLTGYRVMSKRALRRSGRSAPPGSGHPSPRPADPARAATGR